MKLLTHNMLACHIKTVKNGYPFKIEATKVEEIEADYDPDFLRRMFSRIEYKALREAAETLGAWEADTGVETFLLKVVTVFTWPGPSCQAWGAFACMLPLSKFAACLQPGTGLASGTTLVDDS